MSNYTKTVDFAIKDGLSPGTPAKAGKGTEIDTELNNIATAIATKRDATGYAAFNAQRTSSSTALPASTITTVIAATENQDVLSSYNHTTGIFTAPSNGFYLFTGLVGIDNASGVSAVINSVYFSKNGATGGVAGRFFFGAALVGTTLTTGNSAHYTGAVIIELSATDTLQIKVDMGAGGACTANLGTLFAGVFLG